MRRERTGNQMILLHESVTSTELPFFFGVSAFCEQIVVYESSTDIDYIIQLFQKAKMVIGPHGE